MSFKLLAADLDGTLLPGQGGISERVKAAIGRAQARGIAIVLASGRTFASTAAFARELRTDAPIICHQGALVKEPVTGRVLHEDLVPIDLMRDVVAFSRQHDLHVNVYIDDQTYMEKPGIEVGLYSALSRRSHHPVSDLMAALDRNPTKCIWVSATLEGTEAILPQLRKAFEGRLRVVRSHPLLIEGVMPTVSKGRGLALVADHLGVAQAETVAIGDNENDLEMIEWAGLGLAMGNATSEVKAAADCVLPPISEDGAAYGIESYVLNGRSCRDAR